jgi:hypothetical protein
MASATLTFSQFSPGVKYLHAGVAANGGHLTVCTTVCPSTVLSIVKVPNKSTIIDFWGRVQTGGADQTMQMGTSFTRSGIMSVTTLSQSYSTSLSGQLVVPTAYGIFNQGVFRGGGGTTGLATGVTNLMPAKISLSDDVSPSNVAIQATMGVACSASAFFTFMFLYVCDGMAGRTTIR